MEKIASKSNDILPAENLEYTDTTYQVNVPLGKKLKLVSDSGVRPSFLMVGNGILNKNNKAYSMNYTEELLNMTKPEGFMFKKLMENRKKVDETGIKRSNLTYIDNSELTKTEKQYIKIAYKTLREKDLIIRYKRGHYIINTRLVISQDSWEKEEIMYKDEVTKLEK